MTALTKATQDYNRRFGRFGWQPGCLRMTERGNFYFLPRWADSIESLAEGAWLRFRGRCTSCRMRGGHKMGCSRRGR